MEIKMDNKELNMAVFKATLLTTIGLSLAQLAFFLMFGSP